MRKTFQHSQECWNVFVRKKITPRGLIRKGDWRCSKTLIFRHCDPPRNAGLAMTSVILRQARGIDSLEIVA